MSPKEAAGRHLIIGVEGKRVTTSMVRQFEKTHAGGLILFARNFESPAQIKRLIFNLQKKLGRKLLVAVDQEGGRVIRFTKGITQFPDALSIGTRKDVEFVKRQGRIEAEELKILGIDINLAPVLDVLGKQKNPAIGNRSYGHDPKWVAKLGAARIKALQENGVAACAKHFPGLGPATLDPHHRLPKISIRLNEIRKIHLLPFRVAIRAGVRAVMSTHVLYPALDPDKSKPATFSKKMIQGLLRRRLGFRGLILTDDLEMGALRSFGEVGTAAVKAVRAGHDRVLICKNADAQWEAFEKLRKIYQS